MHSGIKTPCFGCVPPERRPGCCCDKKREWDAKRANEKAEKRKEQDADDYCIRATRKSEERAARHRKWGGRHDQ